MTTTEDAREPDLTADPAGPSDPTALDPTAQHPSASASHDPTPTPTTSGPIAPGSLVRVRDETWLVTSIEDTADGPLYTVRGVSALVRDTTATFYSSLDQIAVIAPEDTRVVADPSPGSRRTRLWLEATLRKTPLPMDHAGLTVSTRMLADDVAY